MNYQLHYDRLIERARSRMKPDGYTERHHVLPRYLGGGNESNNLVHLTAREHYIAHLLWAKITDHEKAWLAVGRMAGGDRKRLNSKLYEIAKIKSLPLLSKVGLKVGPVVGAMMREQKRGVCGQSLEELQELGRRSGLLNGKANGEKVRDEKLGVFAMTPEQLSEAGSKGAAKLKELGKGIYNQANFTDEQNERRRQGGINGAKRIVEEKLGVHGWTREQRSERARRQNHAAGKSTSSQKWKCDECDLISTPGGIGSHQRRTSHKGKTRIL